MSPYPSIDLFTVMKIQNFVDVGNNILVKFWKLYVNVENNDIEGIFDLTLIVKPVGGRFKIR